MGTQSDYFLHERGLCESDDVGAGTRIWAFAHVMEGASVGRECNICEQTFIETGARIGDRVVVKNGAQVWDGVTLGDDVFVGPNATFSNDLRPRSIRPPDEFEVVPTWVEAGASIGANATIVCGVRIGACAFVGAGAVVTRDVPSHALMVGNPARRLRWVCACGANLGDDLVCECGHRYRLVDERRGLEAIG